MSSEILHVFQDLQLVYGIWPPYSFFSSPSRSLAAAYIHWTNQTLHRDKLSFAWQWSHFFLQISALLPRKGTKVLLRNKFSSCIIPFPCLHQYVCSVCSWMPVIEFYYFVSLLNITDSIFLHLFLFSAL